MKRFAAVLLSVVVAVVVADPGLSQGRGGPGSQGEQKKPLPPFVEAVVPDGKALIYVYRSAGLPSFPPLILSKEGPLGVLDLGTYLTYITEPGTIKLWIVSMSSKELKVEAVAGQIYYVTAGLNPVLFGPPIPGSFLDLKPREDARKEIAGCKPLPE